MIEPTYLGLKLYELLTLAGIIAGPIVAVAITLWVDGRRRDRDQKLLVLRMLLATRHIPADPNFQTAINLIPVEFHKEREIMEAYKEFIKATAVQFDGINDGKIRESWQVNSIRLVYQIAKFLGFELRETDLQTESYLSGGWSAREDILIDSQRAMRDIANNMMLQSRLIANATLTPEERKFLGVEEEHINAQKN